MGQKIHPYGLRLGIIKDWESRWFASKNFSDLLVEDFKLRKFLKEKLFQAGLSKVEIERTANRVNVIVFTAKPGIVIGVVVRALKIYVNSWKQWLRNRLR